MATRRLRMHRAVLWSAVVLALLAVAWFTAVKPRGAHDSLLRTIGAGDYRLVTTAGQPFTQDDMKGQPTAVFFGFTHCPDVCPTTLGEVMAWQEDLKAQGRQLRVLFFTVDPERDTVAILRDYVSWVPGVVGVTGDPAEVQKAMKAFRVFAQKVPLEGGDYIVNHSTPVVLFDKAGEYFGMISYQQEHARAMATIRKLLAG